MKSMLKIAAVLVPVFLLSLAAAQAAEVPVLAAPEVAAVAQVAEPGCGEALPMDEILQVFTPAALAELPLLKAGCTGTYGSCRCFKPAGQSGCITTSNSSDCNTCCLNLHC